MPSSSNPSGNTSRPPASAIATVVAALVGVMTALVLALLPGTFSGSTYVALVALSVGIGFLIAALLMQMLGRDVRQWMWATSVILCILGVVVLTIEGVAFSRTGLSGTPSPEPAPSRATATPEPTIAASTPPTHGASEGSTEVGPALGGEQSDPPVDVASPRPARVLRETGPSPVTISKGDGIDLDSRLPNWGVTETTGRDLKLYETPDGLSLYTPSDDIAVVSEQAGYDECASETQLRDSIGSELTEVGRTFCLRSSEDRWIKITVLGVDRARGECHTRHRCLVFGVKYGYAGASHRRLCTLLIDVVWQDGPSDSTHSP